MRIIKTVIKDYQVLCLSTHMPARKVSAENRIFYLPNHYYKLIIMSIIRFFTFAFSMALCLFITDLSAQDEQIMHTEQANNPVYLYEQEGTWQQITLNEAQNTVLIQTSPKDEGSRYRIIKKSPQGLTYVLEDNTTVLSLKYATDKDQNPILIQHDQKGKAMVYKALEMQAETDEK
ncbi:MAG: hypothetical protein JJT94_06670 [Bernardetiaceae bacterium]|nr:hypothetical protein [Bernardetiaceae bacterium]